MGVRIESNWEDIDLFLTRLIYAPSDKNVEDFELALNISFADVTGKIHVDTGALKGSGKTKSSSGKSKWTGQMGWGGTSPGFLPVTKTKRPSKEVHPLEDRLEQSEVVYAFYEAGRDGTHDYLRDHEKYEKTFEDVFMLALE